MGDGAQGVVRGHTGRVALLALAMAEFMAAVLLKAWSFVSTLAGVLLDAHFELQRIQHPARIGSLCWPSLW